MNTIDALIIILLSLCINIAYPASEEPVSDNEHYNTYTNRNPQIGLSAEKLLIFDNDLGEINTFNLTWSSYYWENVSLQASCGLGYSNNLTKSSLGEIIDGKIKVFNLDLSVKRHFALMTSPADYYLILGFNIEVFKWAYKESYESYSENGYTVMEDEDGSAGLGLYCGVGITSFSLGEIIVGMECTPGIIFLPPYSDVGFDNLLSNISYLRLRLFINYESY